MSQRELGTIDITKMVTDGRACFVQLGTAFLLESVSKIPFLAWLNLPVIKQAFDASLRFFLTLLSEWVVLQAFILNTIYRKHAQAHDYISAIDALYNLPKTASKKEFEDAEKKRMAAFRNFVLLSN